MKYASLFSGAGGDDLGATQVGLDYVWGIERNKLKWQVNRLNFHLPMRYGQAIRYIGDMV